MSTSLPITPKNLRNHNEICKVPREVNTHSVVLRLIAFSSGIYGYVRYFKVILGQDVTALDTFL
jgi:hypothetical protein